MIASDEYLKKICRNYHLVENYMQARFDKENKWEMHHRREIDENKSRQQLIDEENYYDVAQEELVFLTKDEHNKLHHKDKIVSAETRKKMSEALTGKESSFKGKHYSTAAKQKISKLHKGKKLSDKHRNKISDALTGEKNPAFGKPGTMLGRHWWNNGIINISSKDCPGEDFVLGRIIK